MRFRVVEAPGVAADSGTRMVAHCEYPPDTLHEHYQRSKYYVRMLEKDDVACVQIWGYGHLTGKPPTEGFLIDSVKRPDR